MPIYDDYFDELIHLIPSMNDSLQIKKYKDLRIHFENNLSKEFFTKLKNLMLKYLQLNITFQKIKKQYMIRFYNMKLKTL